MFGGDNSKVISLRGFLLAKLGRDQGYPAAIGYDPTTPIPATPTDGFSFAANALARAPGGHHRNIDWDVEEVMTGASRADWLRYAWHWVQKTDPNGYLEMPGSRQITNGHSGTPDGGVARPPSGRRRWYHANNPGAAVPDGMGDEETISAIWAADST